MPWYVLSGAYLIAWSGMLVHCLLQRRFYPVLGSRWGTKVFWLLTFVFLNPLLTFLYFVFGFLLRPAKNAPPRRLIGIGSPAAVAFVAFVVAFFEWPFTDYPREPVILKNDAGRTTDDRRSDVGPSSLVARAGGGALPWGQAQLALVKAKNGVQTFGSTSAESDDKASLRSIVLICQNPHPLLDRATRQLQKALIRLADVEKVEYYPCGTWPEPGGVLPDVFIALDILELRERAFLCNRRLGAVIQWQVSNALFPGPAQPDLASAPPAAAFYMESRLDHDSAMTGIESPRSAYKIEAASIAAEMAKSVSKQFASLLDRYGQMPPVPAMLCGTYREPPEFSFLKDNNAERLVSASGLFKDNSSVWRFAEQRRTDEALAAYRDQLQSAGWQAGTSAKDCLQMQKENERIYIFRERRKDSPPEAVEPGESGKPALSTMIAHYESCFTAGRIQEAMDALLAGQTQAKTLLAFEHCFRTPEQTDRLRAAIEAGPSGTLDEFLALCRYWADRGQADKARESLMRARAMQRAEKQRSAKSAAIRALAKKLGDESLAEAPVSEQVLADVGFVNAGQLSGPLKIEKALDEPVLLYRRLDDGRLHTLALRVVRSRDVAAPAPYELLAVDGREDRLSASEVAGTAGPDGSWAADFLLHGAAGESDFAQTTVTSVGDGRFLFVVHP